MVHCEHGRNGVSFQVSFINLIFGFGLTSCNSNCSPLTANIYFPAIPTMASAFHVSIEKINLTVTVYMIMQGICKSSRCISSCRSAEYAMLSTFCVGLRLRQERSQDWLPSLLISPNAVLRWHRIDTHFGLLATCFAPVHTSSWIREYRRVRYGIR